eukprot:gnl/MRDRNA2_/MRDRNA2_89635_c0_seq1.p1 gnl/MRDRNA2_/MRDRNA2_89635_c0~~gnl/MRDRNA2_/MRDRNA2_89635_c0_seq1.p1  ORF type:complete len:835 (-),score=188.21 gnl/MRDRNA2_/MRDRNA2_89635_c0_seq1:196-2388(-)
MSGPPARQLRSHRSRSLAGPPRRASRQDRKTTPSPSELQCALLRSPSVESQLESGFQHVNFDHGDGISYEEFKQWQLGLLEASKKSSATKKHRLACLVRELQRHGTSTAWRNCTKALEAASSLTIPLDIHIKKDMPQGYLSRADKKKKDMEKALVTAYGLGMAGLDRYEECLIEALEIMALEEAEASGKAVSWRDAVTAIDNIRESARTAGGRTEIFGQQQSRIHGWRQSLRDECLAALSEAATTGHVVPLAAAIDDASSVLEAEELIVYKESLTDMKKPFLVHVMTLSGQSCSVEVSRTQFVKSLKEQVAEHFAVQPYRIGLACEMGPLEPNNETLEHCGVISMDMQLAAMLGPEDRWQEVPISEVLDSAVKRRIANHGDTYVARQRFEAGDLSEEDCRAMFAPQLKVLDDQEAERKRLAEEAAAEKQRKAEEAAAEIRRQADERQAKRHQQFEKMDAEALLHQAADLGLVQSSEDNTSAYGASKIQVRLVECVALHQGIKEEKMEARSIEDQCMADERELHELAAQAQEIKNDAQVDLDEALPALHAASRSLECLDKRDICEMKAFASPPRLVCMTLEAVCILFDIRPQRLMGPDGQLVDVYWEVSKRQLLNDCHFMRRLLEFDKDNIPERVIRRLQPYIDNEEFVPETLSKMSRACQAFCIWVRSMHTYHHVAQRCEPKRQKLREAEQAMESMQQTLRKRRESLVNVLDAVKSLERKLEILGQPRFS